LGEGSCFSFIIPLEACASDAGFAEKRINHVMQIGQHHPQQPTTYHASSSPESSKNSPQSNKQGNQAQPIRLLLAEDDPISQKIAEKRLAREGFVVTVANDGDEAWQIIQQQHAAFDVLLTDLRMPGLDGIGLARKLRQHEKEHHLSALTIIGLSAHALREVREECMQVGMNDFLSKPVEVEEVVSVIQHKHLQ